MALSSESKTPAVVRYGHTLQSRNELVNQAMCRLAIVVDSKTEASNLNLYYPLLTCTVDDGLPVDSSTAPALPWETRSPVSVSAMSHEGAAE